MMCGVGDVWPRSTCRSSTPATSAHTTSSPPQLGAMAKVIPTLPPHPRTEPRSTRSCMLIFSLRAAFCAMLLVCFRKACVAFHLCASRRGYHTERVLLDEVFVCVHRPMLVRSDSEHEQHGARVYNLACSSHCQAVVATTHHVSLAHARAHRMRGLCTKHSHPKLCRGDRQGDGRSAGAVSRMTARFGLARVSTGAKAARFAAARRVRQRR